MDWKVEIRNRRGILATATHPDSATALDWALHFVCKYARDRKHVSVFVSYCGEHYEYHS